VVFTGIFNQEIGSLKWFLVNLLIGSLSLAVGQSFLAGIASKANNNATLLAVLSVPVMAPLILFMVRISNNAIDNVDASVIIQDLFALGSINVIIIAVSFLLFPYLWRS
jgi:heme exporter protein B